MGPGNSNAILANHDIPPLTRPAFNENLLGRSSHLRGDRVGRFRQLPVTVRLGTDQAVELLDDFSGTLERNEEELYFPV